MYGTHRHDLFYITKKYHQNIPNGLSYGADTTLHLKPPKGNKSESIKARVVILVRDTSS